jgi:glycosyltransferase involved in cell wall biosynthesis
MEDGKTGIVIQKADVSSLQAAMEKLAGNESLRMQYGTAGHAFADTHFEQNALFEQIYLDRKALVAEK